MFSSPPFANTLSLIQTEFTLSMSKVISIPELQNIDFMEVSRLEDCLIEYYKGEKQ